MGFERESGPVLLDELEERLVQRKFLYDHPSEYSEGVTATIAALREEWQKFTRLGRAG